MMRRWSSLERHSFRLLNYHLVQKGSSFPHPIELSMDGSTGQVTVQYTDKGKEQTLTDRLKLPPGMANGLIPILLKNISDSGPVTLSMVAATPKPRLVKLEITRQRRRTVLARGFEPQSHALRREVRDRWGRRGDGSAIGEAAAGHPCMDSRRRGPSFRQDARTALLRRTYLANRAGLSGLALKSAYAPRRAESSAAPSGLPRPVQASHPGPAE